MFPALLGNWGLGTECKLEYRKKVFPSAIFLAQIVVELFPTPAFLAQARVELFPTLVFIAWPMREKVRC